MTVAASRFVAVVWCVCAATLLAQSPCPPAEQSAIGGAMFDMVIHEDVAYIANGGGGLLVLDLHDPARPTELAGLALPGQAQAIALEPAAQLAYIAGADGGLHVIDVAHPERPRLVYSLATNGLARDVAIADGLLLVAQSEAGLGVYDLTNPRVPAFRSHLVTPELAVGVAAQDSLAVVALARVSPILISLEDPAAPSITATLTELTSCWDVDMGDGYVYAQGRLSAVDLCIATYDVGDPAAPVQTDADCIAGGRLRVAQDRLLVTRHRELLIYDLADPSQPELAERISTGVYLTAVAWTGGPWVVAGSEAMLTIESDPPHGVLGRFDQVDLSQLDRAVVGGDLMVTGGAFQVVDVADPTTPTFRGRAEIYGYDAAIDGDLAYVTRFLDLTVIDLGDPSRPTAVGSVRVPGSDAETYRVEVRGNIAYTYSLDMYFRIITTLASIDVHDPTNPAVLDTLVGVGNAFDMAVGDGLIITADGPLRFVDATDPADLRPLGQFEGSYNAVTLNEDLAFTIHGGPVQSLRIIDASDAAAPRIIADLPLTRAPAYLEDLVVVDGVAYLVGREAGLLRVDVADARDPVELEPVAIAGEPYSITARGTLLVVTTTRGVRLLETGQCGPCRADLDGDGSLTLFDFLTFQNDFATGNLDGADFDGDGVLTLMDFLAYQRAFALGCG